MRKKHAGILMSFVLTAIFLSLSACGNGQITTLDTTPPIQSSEVTLSPDIEISPSVQPNEAQTIAGLLINFGMSRDEVLSVLFPKGVQAGDIQGFGNSSVWDNWSGLWENVDVYADELSGSFYFNGNGQLYEFYSSSASTCRGIAPGDDIKKLVENYGNKYHKYEFSSWRGSVTCYEFSEIGYYLRFYMLGQTEIIESWEVSQYSYEQSVWAAEQNKNHLSASPPTEVTAAESAIPSETPAPTESQEGYLITLTETGCNFSYNGGSVEFRIGMAFADCANLLMRANIEYYGEPRYFYCEPGIMLVFTDIDLDGLNPNEWILNYIEFHIEELITPQGLKIGDSMEKMFSLYGTDIIGKNEFGDYFDNGSGYGYGYYQYKIDGVIYEFRYYCSPSNDPVLQSWAMGLGLPALHLESD
jgi:hypothetical protein